MNFGDVRDRIERKAGPIDDDLASVVATHHIQRDSHKWKERRRKPTHRAPKSLCSSSNGDNLPALVETTRRTHPMRNVRSRALRTGAQLRQLQHAVVSSPHPLTTF